MNKKPEQPKGSAPSAAVTQDNGGVSVNKANSSDPQEQTNFNFQNPANRSASQQLPSGQNPSQSEQKSHYRPHHIPAQQQVAPSKVVKKIDAKPRTLLYVGFAAVTFVAVVIAVTLFVFSVTSKNVKAASSQVAVLPAAGIGLSIAGQLRGVQQGGGFRLIETAFRANPHRQNRADRGETERAPATGSDGRAKNSGIGRGSQGIGKRQRLIQLRQKWIAR
ncbi:MAG: hypothetical protein WCK35_28505, partial [Chloroflexota bacterium]